MLDRPNFRSSHEIAKPTGAGIVFVSIGSIFAAFLGNYLPLICCPLAAIGLLDDLKELSAGLRYIFQLATVLVLIVISPFVQQIHLINPEILQVFVYILLIIFGTAIINFVNFMDGLDGLVAGCMLPVLLMAAFSISPAFLPLVGALTGFLLFNWSPAKVFMGDVGSTFLGALLTGILLIDTNWETSISILLVSSPLLLDALICIPRRLLSGQTIFKAHRLHLYQRLHQAGWSHAKVSTLYILFTGSLGLLMTTKDLKIMFLGIVFQILFAIWLDQNVAIPFSKALAQSNLEGLNS